MNKITGTVPDDCKLSIYFWTCQSYFEQRWYLEEGRRGRVVYGDGLIFVSIDFVAFLLIPCNSTLFYLKNSDNYS